MIRLPPRSTRTDTLLPYTTLFRSSKAPISSRLVLWAARPVLVEGAQFLQSASRGPALSPVRPRPKFESNRMTKRLAVYCGSATPADPVYIETARHVGRALAGRGIGVVYGGGRLGLMGAVAASALEAGGEVIGVIPDALVGTEVPHP